MNLAEKVASTYLRLNGFLFLPNFTCFTGDHHNHIDLVALRAPNSVERVGDHTFLTDDLLFNSISKLLNCNARTEFVGIAAEVRTNGERDIPSVPHTNYVRRFLGNTNVARIAFYEGEHSISIAGNVLDIGMRYAGLWIQERIDWMEDRNLGLTKVGSWNMSESFLSEFLALRSIGLLTDERTADNHA